MTEYTFKYSQLFNIFGAPGIPNEYEARLYRDGRCVKHRVFWWRSRAERQCMEWRMLYDARPA